MKIKTALALLAAAAFAAPYAQADERPPMDYYRVLTEKNIFRKLGWAPPDNRPRFTLILTALTSDEEEAEEDLGPTPEEQFWAALENNGQIPEDMSEEMLKQMTEAATAEASPEMSEEMSEEEAATRRHRALISRQGSNNAFYVEEGDEFEGMTVVSIGYRSVTIANGEGEETNLSLSGGFGSSGGGGGGGSRGGGSRSAPSFQNDNRGTQSRGGMPDEMRERMERLRNASPEERAEIFRQMRGRRGGGDGERRGRRGRD